MLNAYFPKYLHRLLTFLAKNRPKTLFAFLSDFMANICLIAGSVLLAQAVAATFGFHSLRGQMLNPGTWSSLQLLGSFWAIVCLRFALDWLRFGLRRGLSEAFAYELRMSAASQHLYHDLRIHESHDSGRSLLRFAGDLGSIQQLITRGILQCTADIGLLMIGLAIIAWLDLRLAGLVVIGVTAMFLGNRVLTRRLQTLEEDRRRKKSTLLAFMNTLLLQLGAIQALNRSTRIQIQFEKKAQKIKQSSHEYHKIAALQEALPPFFAQSLLAIILFAGLEMGLSGIPIFAIVMILMWWRNPLMRLLRVSLVWKKGALSLQKFEALMETPRAQEGTSVLKKQDAFQLELKNISLRLGQKQVFDNYSVAIEGQQITHLVLPGGGGKTTLAKLLAGLYLPDAGQITWNGKNIQKYTLRSLRQQMAFVSEAFPLTGKHLLDAISPSSQPESIQQAKAAWEDFQLRFPEHLKDIDCTTKLKGPSAPLSASQRRLLECLRAILTNKPLLVLDEPFANLDDNTAQLLAHYLKERQHGAAILLLSSNPKNIFFD